MLSSFLKRTFFPRIYEEEQLHDLQPVFASPDDPTPLYYTPRNLPDSIFQPAAWQPRDFQVGRPLGKGKYAPPHSDTDMSTSPGSGIANTSSP